LYPRKSVSSNSWQVPVHVGNGGGTGAIGTGSVINNTASMINRSTAGATPRLTALGLDEHPVPG
jgi:hypothetical protein